MDRVKDGAQQFAAGGSAGLVEVSVLHPLDLVKTRFQLQGSELHPTRYNGLVDCFMKIAKKEGILAFYKGILPPILAETPKRATKFFSFAQYNKAFKHESLPPTTSISLAGLCSGFTEALIICPFEVVKVRLQLQRGVDLKEQQSTYAMAREIIRTQGIGTHGLYRGLTATLGRDGLWNMIYFGLYHNAKQFLPDSETSPNANFIGRILLGFSAGALSSVGNIPFDVAKSRIQVDPTYETAKRKYNGCFQSIALIYREEGFAALYKGLVPKVLRLGPGGAIMLLVYNAVYDWLKLHT